MLLWQKHALSQSTTPSASKCTVSRQRFAVEACDSFTRAVKLYAAILSGNRMRFLCGNDTVAVAMRFAMKNGQICFSLRKFLAISPAIQKITGDCGCDAVVRSQTGKKSAGRGGVIGSGRLLAPPPRKPLLRVCCRAGVCVDARRVLRYWSELVLAFLCRFVCPCLCSGERRAG